MAKKKRKVVSKEDYKKGIVEAMTNLFTYQPEFDIMIDNLADTMFKKQLNDIEWEKNGYQMVEKHTNKLGFENYAKSMWYMNDLQMKDQIAKYCTKLSLTPSEMNRLGNNITNDKDEFSEFMGSDDE